MAKKKISIVIPCYYSGKTIGYVIESIMETIKKCEKYSYEIILVNDGSQDNTFEVIKEYALKFDNIIGINLTRNFGQHSALMAAYANVSGDYVLGMDDDGEHNPEDMFELVDELEKGYDYVCAEFETNSRSLYKKIGSRFNYWMATKFIGKPRDAIFSSYYIMKRYVVDEIVKSKNPKPYIGGMIVSVTKSLSHVKIQRCDRKSGESNYHLRNSISLWLNGITAYSVIPLRFASLAGMIFSLIGFVSFIVIIIRKLMYPEILAGYTSIIAVILLIGGIIMMLLGIIGEYIGRIYLVENKIPQYAIKEKISLVDDGEKK